MCRMNKRLGKGETGLPKKWSKASSRGKGGPENFSCEYKGVRQRTWGKWVAEIRDPGKRSRVWLGTFNTKEEAAAAYDRKALQFFGPNAHFNLQSSQLAPKSNQNAVFTPLFSVPPRTLFSRTDPYPQVSEAYEIPPQPLKVETNLCENFEALYTGSNDASLLQEPFINFPDKDIEELPPLHTHSVIDETQDFFIPLQVKGLKKNEELPALDVDCENLDKQPDFDFASYLNEIAFKYDGPR
ncbi:EREBP-like factor [Marchantia polymorpha subsp. ruderalis]|uniref:AP2/ERF domain-containing protein n=2 Tax=Marchantia polymorpha TaxID=3197 RepID=A0AAF6BDM1_MARPO|nr:hypothetical protein MARPO_0293s0001 [Marchantia polymorpha]BBN10105.1 hypothetical protein Mp_5g01050 [Marchantia polymorpha subsp. ruderalis]|eukprot:PTQ26872.1 hypothetical protein MARPO_0293s0001 [Marchantia polymorpha]